jgi:hypothetical protein
VELADLKRYKIKKRMNKWIVSASNVHLWVEESLEEVLEYADASKRGVGYYQASISSSGY